MKKVLLTLILVSAVFSSPLLFAQDAGGTGVSSTPVVAPGSEANGQRTGKWKAVFEQLDLTAAQKAQIKQIRASTPPGSGRRQQIMAVLTPDQKAKLVASLKEYRADQAGQ